MSIRAPMVLLALGAAIGLGASQLHAQAQTTMPRAYVMADFELTDAQAIKPYAERVQSTLEPFGGRFLVRGGKAARLEGELPQGRFVVIEFDSFERAQAWYDSPEYQKLIPIRHASGKTRLFIVEGVRL